MEMPSVLRVAVDPTGFNGRYDKNLTLVVKTPDYQIMQYICDMYRIRYERIFMNESTNLKEMITSGVADISLNHFRMTESDYKDFDYSASYMVKEVKFAMEEAGQQPKFEIFTSPFSPGVWISCLVTAMVATLVTRWVTRRSTTPLVHLFVGIVGSLLRQPLMQVEIGSKKKIVWWSSWLVFTTVISTSYSALFFSFLLAPAKLPKIQTFRELSVAVQDGRYKCAAQAYFVTFMSESDEEYLRKLAERCESYRIAKVTNQFIDKTSAFIANDMFLSVMQLEPPSRVHYISEDTLKSWHVGIAMRKDFCCHEAVNLAVLSALSAGLVQQWYKWGMASYSRRNELRRWEFQKEETHSLAMADLQYIFIAYLIGIAFSVFVFLCEILIPKRIVNKFVLCPKKNIFDV